VGAWHDGRQHGATSARGTLSFVKREYSAGMKKIGMELVRPALLQDTMSMRFGGLEMWM
jgi:hypothetical protein